MTRMERLADWLTGGALTRARAERDRCNGNTEFWYSVAQRHKDALRTIAAMKTPHANATVTRMAKVAKEALNHGE